MSFTVGPLNIVAGTATSITFPGDLGAIAYVKIANASPLTVQLTNLGPGQDWLQPMEANVWPMTGVTGAISVNPTADLVGLTSGISALFVTCYMAGEQGPAGNYPNSLGLLTYIGGGSLATAQQIINDTNGVGATLIESTPTGGAYSTWEAFNDGTLNLSVAPEGLVDAGHRQDALVMNQGIIGTAVPVNVQFPNGFQAGDTTTNPAGPYILQVGGASVVNASYDAPLVTMDSSGDLALASGNLTVHGTSSLDNGLIATNGTGNLTAKHVSMTQLTNTGTSSLDNGLIATNGTGNLTAKHVSMTQLTNTGTSSLDNGLIATNGSGALTVHTITVNAPPTLATGNQETGYVGIQFKAVAGADTFGVGVNFKTVMTNVPSSITLNSITTGNASGPTAAHITAQGFFFGISATAPGAGFWVGTYTTVGN